MKKLEDYDVLVNDVFYRTTHILDYIKTHPNMDDLDKKAIKATIMDALVYTKEIDPENEFLDFDNMVIDNNPNNYKYEKHPDVCGMPMWMKEAYRRKSIEITGGIPISIFLARPSSKFVRYCVYDPNTAASAIFKDATFYNVFYTSPTRGIRIEEKRPFVEVEINGTRYLIDTLTKRIFKSSFFKENYGFEIVDQYTISKLSRKAKKFYINATRSRDRLAEYLMVLLPLMGGFDTSVWEEFKYEVEKSKTIIPDEWARYRDLQDDYIEFLNKHKERI